MFSFTVVNKFNSYPTVYSLLTVFMFVFLAVCFKNAKQYEQAKDAYLKEAEYHTENKAYPLFTPP